MYRRRSATDVLQDEDVDVDSYYSDSDEYFKAIRGIESSPANLFETLYLEDVSVYVVIMTVLVKQ